MEQSFRYAAEWDGPIVVHVLTEKGRGYAPAEQDDIQRLHDFRVQAPVTDEDLEVVPASYTDAFSRALVEAGERDERVVALTAAMPGPTGLLPFQERFPTRFFDVGIAEQHEMTAAAGMAMGGLRPVVAVYSTFFTRAFDQANLDVGLHRLPVVTVLDRAGHHRRRRPEPPRRARPPAVPLDPGHDGLRAVERRGGRRDARDGAVAARSLLDPVREDAAAEALRRRRRGAARPAAARGRRVGVHPRGGQARRRLARRGRPARAPTASSPRSTTSASSRRPTPR